MSSNIYNTYFLLIIIHVTSLSARFTHFSYIHAYHNLYRYLDIVTEILPPQGKLNNRSTGCFTRISSHLPGECTTQSVSNNVILAR